MIVLLAHLQPTIFLQKDVKIGLEFSKCTLITLEVVVIASWNFATWRTPRWGGDNAGTTFGGTAPSKFGKAKIV